MSSKRILLVEDNPVNQKVAELMLKRIGYLVDIAEDGKVATEKVQQENYPVILMDSQMPVMNGVDATNWIRANIPAESQPKIFVMSAALLSESRVIWDSVKVDGFIEKPIRIEILQSTLDPLMQSL